MGTYTTNYNLFMPTIGEQGWGELVNGNFTTIDTAMKGLSNSIGSLETEVDVFDGRITAVETSITGITTVTSGTATNCFHRESSSFGWICILPISTHKYTGSINIKNTWTASGLSICYFTEFNTTATKISVATGNSTTITFNDASVLYIGVSNIGYIDIGAITLS